MKEEAPLFLRSIAIIKKIPKGKVLTYNRIAEIIGAPGCARHVSFVLSSSSKKYKLPWHRVINSSGQVSLHKYSLRQIQLLKKEKIEFQVKKIELENYMWKPTKVEIKKILKGIPEHIPLYLR